MAEYATSKESRNKIIEACKELFFLQGYKKTTYVDICNKANSNPGLINYYFKTKKNIAAYIYGEFYLLIKECVKMHMLKNYGYYDLQYGTTLEFRILTYLINNNPRLQTFYYDISVEGIEYDIELFYCCFKLLVDEYRLNFSEDEIKLIETSIVGSTMGITKRQVEGYFNCDFYMIYKFIVKSMFTSLGITSQRISEIFSVTEEMFSHMEVELQDYFLFSIK